MKWFSSNLMAHLSRNESPCTSKRVKTNKAVLKQIIEKALEKHMLLLERRPPTARTLFCLATIILLCIGHGVAADQPSIEPRKDYAAAVALLRPFIEQQVAEKQLPALSIALVDDQQVVWAQGFGLADPQAKVVATAQTVYRIGSVSKLFTDIGIMQLVE